MTSEPTTPGWHFDNTYARLPEMLFSRVNPVFVSQPRVALFNEELALALGLDVKAFERPDGIAQLAGNALPPRADPIAQAYAGHQFGGFTNLGDGRAILLGEQLTPQGKRWDIQLKGSGQTPYSRSGDGRAALGPMIREYLISEAMHALGIPTTRSLAVVTTGEPVFRDKPLQGAILTRVASSHIRVGTFEYASARRDVSVLKALADYTIHRHYPDLSGKENPYLALLKAVIDRQASLIAKWLHVGFIHGVMNTDNMALSGETIDYGPCAFMDHYDPDTVFSSIDHQGRYAFARQPAIAHWNLTRFAETLIPLIHEDQSQSVEIAKQALEEIPGIFQNYWLAGMKNKLGIQTQEAADVDLIRDLLIWMHTQKADYTLTFRRLSEGTLSEQDFFQQPVVQSWATRWQQRLERQNLPMHTVLKHMRSYNPVVIPRNVYVENALAAATEQGNFGPIHELLHVVAKPYESIPGLEKYLIPPLIGPDVYQTFCGT